MIKYANILGYRNKGEVGGAFSHVYQFIENNKEDAKIILVHAYDGPTEVFKGYLWNNRYEYMSVELLEDEIMEISNYCGELIQKEFDEFIIKTVFKNDYKDFTKREELYKSKSEHLKRK